MIIVTNKTEGKSQVVAYNDLPENTVFLKDISNYKQVLYEIKEKYAKIHVHIDLESVKEADGVTEPFAETFGVFGALTA